MKLAMFDLALLTSIAIPITLLIMEVRRTPTAKIVLNHFWYFSLIWAAAFPFRAWLINDGLVTPQTIITGATKPLSEIALAQALILSLGFWGVAYAGYRTTSISTASSNERDKPSEKRLLVSFAGLIVLAVAGLMLALPNPNDLAGDELFKARAGIGIIWVLPDFVLYSGIVYIAYLANQFTTPLSLPRLFVFALLILLALGATELFFSRRFISAIALALTLMIVIRNPKWWPLGLCGVLGTVFASGLFEVIRRVGDYLNQNDALINNLAKLLYETLIKFHLHLISTSFEGIEHLAHFLRKASWPDLLTGVDYGISWAFNLGLSLVPRAVWASKPLVYGGLDELQWLYPHYFEGAFPSTAIPISFIVDFIFGFGLIVAVVLTFLLGRFLAWNTHALWNSDSNFAVLALSFYSFIFMFNLVRSGTGFGHTVLLFTLVCGAQIGFNRVIPALGSMMRAIFSLDIFRKRHNNNEAIFFYPHSYLRDRQLDTIARWNGEIANPEMAHLRKGDQVTKQQSLTPARPSWKTRIPLLNIKLRPSDTPKNSPLYIWGGLALNGPFITDIDNPYAFTAYNPFAVNIYRPFIRTILESSRCLQIRCLSEACRGGVLREYGPIAGEKAVVVYPQITASPSNSATDREECRFLFVSTQFEIKGGRALLRAFKKVREAAPMSHLDLVTYLPPELTEECAATPGITVHEANYSRSEISERFMAHADVFVHPTYFDSFGMVVLEALAHGLPIIATDVYAIREMVKTGENGILLHPPLSIWNDTTPSPLFSSIEKVQTKLLETDTSEFENALAQSMISYALDRDMIKLASTKSVELFQSEFTTSA